MTGSLEGMLINNWTVKIDKAAVIEKIALVKPTKDDLPVWVCSHQMMIMPKRELDKSMVARDNR
ncbi:hypothetical protein LAC30SC_05350 [Lactobacillus amylovorus]|uniref:Uncharacterized protein n=2 Tax=Lactobacillus TaxID=1578 RepID=A0A0R1NP81_9LACO|nr:MULTISPECIES: hypothetical protein [Lactobacillus]ADZ07218.1 hypothetical protein LAC30SC_05350 [Lactobacillus amylovorus]MCT6889369.1 hypothetical protein [Lactobacillus sp.]OXC42439.1 hypothetical protein AYP95_09210 [Lactobacillus crispatus]KRL22206.1 hypothetical protein FC37_GL001065 [Lactobacillus gallinarum DSM 10532 = JCM 2011]OXC42868.1 hypothetical protein AYP94_08105 [Lactobacillus crispatus]